MKQKLTKLCTLLLLAMVPAVLPAQEAITASGGSASGSGGSISYTVGQVVYTTHSSSNGSIAQGVQQPYEISEVIGIEEAKGITLQYTAYPNPVQKNLILKIESENELTLSVLSYHLYDLNGKLIKNKRIDNYETTILMEKYTSAIYFLKIYSDNNEIKTFKIVKR